MRWHWSVMWFLVVTALCAQPPSSPAAKPHLHSRILVYDLRQRSSHVVFESDGVWEAPNWSPDGSYLIVNSDGRIYRLDLSGAGPVVPQVLSLPADYVCNNDKALSPDGHLLGFSATHAPDTGSEVYVSDAGGANIRQLTHTPPSYFHGWSPDSRTMAFVAQRGGSGQFDVYSISAQGGAETRLTTDPHHDDGPDYSPDGRWIYINSNRSGHESIWRFPASGAGPDDQRAEQVVADGAEDWFPHLSPSGKELLYIAYPAGTATHDPRDLLVELRLSDVAEGKVSTPRTLARFTGGQGTLNVNSWAPDSQRFAYVEYRATP